MWDYLGFCIVRPVIDSMGNFLIGRTVLKTYEHKDDQKQVMRYYTTHECMASLCGHQFTVQSLPFQAQDGVVGACATVALWIASNALNNAFDTKVEPPSNITKIATKYITIGGCFPSEGLTPEQMIGYIQALDLDVDIVNVSQFDADFLTYKTVGIGMEAAKLAIMAYHNVRIAPIAMIAIRSKGQEHWDYHAAVVSGYRVNAAGEMDEIYLHDDQVGPFCHTEFIKASIKGSYFLKRLVTDRLKNQWVESGAADEVVLLKLIIPRYPKIRMTITKMMPAYARVKSAMGNDVNVKMLVYRVQDYKREILQSDVPIVDKTKTLLFDLPKYILVFRSMVGKDVVGDIIFDATSPHPNLIFINNYRMGQVFPTPMSQQAQAPSGASQASTISEIPLNNEVSALFSVEKE